MGWSIIYWKWVIWCNGFWNVERTKITIFRSFLKFPSPAGPVTPPPSGIRLKGTLLYTYQLIPLYTTLPPPPRMTQRSESNEGHIIPPMVSGVIFFQLSLSVWSLCWLDGRRNEKRSLKISDNHLPQRCGEGCLTSPRQISWRYIIFQFFFIF